MGSSGPHAHCPHFKECQSTEPSEGTSSNLASYVSVVDLVRLTESCSAFDNQKLLNSPLPETDTKEGSQQQQQHQVQQQPYLLGPGPTYPAMHSRSCLTVNNQPGPHCGYSQKRHRQHRPQAVQQQAATTESDVFLSHKSASINVHDFADDGVLVAHFLVRLFISKHEKLLFM